jgi:hypothetical protein
MSVCSLNFIKIVSDDINSKNQGPRYTNLPEKVNNIKSPLPDSPKTSRDKIARNVSIENFMKFSWSWSI